MGRKILAVVVALITAFAVIMIVEMINSVVVMPPSSEIVNDPTKFREFMSTVPLTAHIVVLAGYFLGSFAGGYMVTKLSRRESPGISLPLLIGVILTIVSVLNFFVLLPGQPMWFAIVGILIFIPVTLLGHKLAT